MLPDTPAKEILTGRKKTYKHGNFTQGGRTRAGAVCNNWHVHHDTNLIKHTLGIHFTLLIYVWITMPCGSNRDFVMMRSISTRDPNITVYPSSALYYNAAGIGSNSFNPPTFSIRATVSRFPSFYTVACQSRWHAILNESEATQVDTF